MTSGHTSSGGPFSRRAGEILQEATGAEEVLLTTSCTDALELSCLLLDIGPGDTVVVPSFTFTSSALAYARQGARILFCDIEPDTLGLDPRHLAELLDDSVRAVVAVHYAGVGCDVAGIREVLADRPDVALVEDAAHGLFGSWRGEPLGGIGRIEHAELPRDQELRLRRGRRDPAQRPRPTSTGRGCSTTRAPTGRRSSWARSTSTPGATPAPPSGSPTCWPAYLLGPARAGGVDPGPAAPGLRGLPGGARRARRRARAPAAGRCRRTATRPGTCSTCCCPTPRCGRR